MKLAHKSLDAELQRFSLGASTSTLVLQNQTGAHPSRNYTSLRHGGIRKVAGGTGAVDRTAVLEHSGIRIADAERGEVTHKPTTHIAAPSKDLMCPIVTRFAAVEPNPITHLQIRQLSLSNFKSSRCGMTGVRWPDAVRALER